MDKFKTVLALVICRVVWLGAFLGFLMAGLTLVLTLLQEVSMLQRLREAIVPGILVIITLAIAIAGIKLETKLKKTL